MEVSLRLSSDELTSLVREAGLRTRELVGDLHDQQLTVRRCEIVNPFLWEIGHVAFFYELFLLRELDDTPPLIEGCEDLYDSFSVAHDDRWSLELPCRERSLEYSDRVQELVLRRLAGREPDARECYHYLLAARHEDMHAEAFTTMRQTLEYAAPAPGLAGTSATEHGGGPCAGDIDFLGGPFQLGAGADAGFVFDNEKWAHPIELEPFSMARAPVTCGEYAEFVASGGYQEARFWSRQGWQWRMRQGAQNPLYWRKATGGWMRMHFDTLLPLEEHHPVCNLSWYEAEAYCRWAGRRLPSEAEWEFAASREPADALAKHRLPWGSEPADLRRANVDWAGRGCVDVGAHARGDTANGLRQMIGNVWEWTSSDFYPYPGFLVDRPYKQYSAPWFGYRKVLRGGSWATRGRLLTNTYRNFFPPERNDIFAGFRTCAP